MEMLISIKSIDNFFDKICFINVKIIILSKSCIPNGNFIACSIFRGLLKILQNYNKKSRKPLFSTFFVFSQSDAYIAPTPAVHSRNPLHFSSNKTPYLNGAASVPPL